MSTAATPALRHPGTGRVRDLLSQVAWFNRLRLLAAIGALVLVATGHGLQVIDSPGPLYALAAAILLLDVAYIRFYPRLHARSASAVRRHVDLQIALDLVLLTGLLHWSGGVTNPFVLFYLFHGSIASLLLSVREALLVAASSIGCVSALAFGERFGLVAHHPLVLFGERLGWGDLATTSPLAIFLWLSAFALTFAFSMYFVATVLQRLRRSEDELVVMSRHLALSEKLAAVGTLAAGVSHEINNPVGVIQSKVEILRYRLDDGDAPAVLRAELDTIDKHVRRIRAVTAGLLTFSRETPFALQPIGWNDLVSEGCELVRVSFHAAGLSLALDLDAGEPRVLGSTNHLLQVLVNILLNARDASPPGGTVTVATGTDGEEAFVRIADQGAGIAPEHLPKIFDPFFTTKEVDKGTGLGLAISHGIVERHNGRILVASEAGSGAEFVVRIPLVP